MSLLGNSSIWILCHSCEVNSDLAIAQYPAIGKAHFSFTVICNNSPDRKGREMDRKAIQV